MEVEVQRIVDLPNLPADDQFRAWARAAAGDKVARNATVVIRIVDETESSALNQRYRRIDRATNVLSFGADAPPGVDWPHLGDLVICAPVVAREATEQDKRLVDHWAHLVIHGMLHLQGHDHADEEQAAAMEAREREILARFDIPDPYRVA